MDWNIDLKQMLATTAPLIQRGELMQATQAIQRALGARTASWPTASAAAAGAADPVASPARAQRAWHAGPGHAADVQDVEVVDRAGPRARADAAGVAQPADAQPPGSFERIAFSAPGGAPQDHYWLYVPPGAASAAAQPMPLVLMLHGCTQNPQDFATGTAMNGVAQTANALVLYPAQAQQANPKNCWNWFRPEDQLRGAGEPATLVAMVRDVMRRHPVDERRVYVAGLSAGGAMAALLGREYPDVFAAVGVHSGLQPGAARNVMGALSAMKSGAKLPPAPAAPMPAGQALPALIVFHGDADRTVAARNAEQLVQVTLAARGHAPGETAREVQSGQSAAGQRYTRTLYAAADSQPGGSSTLVEQWMLHGAGHAWAGGDARGSHTDPRGVNASQEMLRFFLEHPRRR
ncbi:extracellular catalytic domain type 1 short-chain-length polyhydroxyalkanoate depolymerase [Comamonas sp.]|uniref:extracellular catalytic domain type 1 short-chain-length polyhydroxyalkanoate depolymerase n=1 Tax=Comamonas sp. TaxID=34028 RepID=UPI002FC83E22